jgi:C4-dicarboxylate-specific signal transduction histidine kinase
VRTFQDLPIRRKLTWLVLLAGGAPILLSSIALLANNVYLLRSSEMEELTSLASVLGDTSAAALAFDDPAAARDVLKSVGHQPDIRFACVYTGDGKPFAWFDATQTPGWKPPEVPQGERCNVVEGRFVDAVQQFPYGDKTGTIYLRSTLDDAFTQLAYSALTITVLGLLSLLVAAAILSRLQRSVSEPILRLASTAEQISAGRDYSIRVRKAADDEVGKLYDQFNAMLDEIQRGQDQLHEAQAELEVRVEDRTRRLSEAVEDLRREIADRERAEKQLAEVHQQLVETARRAGMAEVATGVLHNVGNVLNSVNVSATVVSDHLRSLRLNELSRALDLLESHAADLGDFLVQHHQGKQLPRFLRLVSDHLAKERAALLAEMQSLVKNVDHIKTIVAMQQSYAGVAGIVETVNLAELADDALKMDASSLEKHHIEVVRDYADLPDVSTQKQKLLQILVNLVANAKDALSAAETPRRRLVVRIAPRYVDGQDQIAIEVSDNGAGIRQEDMTKIFSHGFTTKKHGHGFGLHSSANAAKELDGSLFVESPGPGHGATFTIHLPLITSEVFA